MIFRTFLTIVILALSPPSLASEPVSLEELSQFTDYHNENSFPGAMKRLGFKEPYSNDQIQTGYNTLALAYYLSHSYVLEALKSILFSLEFRSNIYRKEKKLLLQLFEEIKVTHVQESLDRIVQEKLNAEFAAFINPSSRDFYIHGVRYQPKINDEELIATVYDIAADALNFHIKEFANNEAKDKITLSYTYKISHSDEMFAREIRTADPSNIRQTKAYKVHSETISQLYENLEDLLKEINKDSQYAQNKIKRLRQVEEHEELNFRLLIYRINAIPVEISQLPSYKQSKAIKNVITKLNAEFSELVRHALNIIDETKLRSLENSAYTSEVTAGIYAAEFKINKINARFNINSILEEFELTMEHIDKSITQIKRKKNINTLQNKFTTNLDKFLRLKGKAFQLLFDVISEAEAFKITDVNINAEFEQITLAIKEMVSINNKLDANSPQQNRNTNEIYEQLIARPDEFSSIDALSCINIVNKEYVSVF